MLTRKSERVYSNAGSRIRPVYEGRYNPNGKLSVVQTGEENLYDFIQSHAESVDIQVLLKRYMNGDVSALNRVQGFYGDVSELPKTYAEMMEKIRQGEEYFKSLPLEVREAFGQDSGRFLAGLSDGSTMEILSKFAPEKSKPDFVPAIPEVKKDAEVSDSDSE